MCRALPIAWRREPYVRVTGKKLAQGYIRFFEPDVYVEAQPGLADKCGIDRNFGFRSHNRVVTLDDFVTREDGGVPEFAFGLSMIDAYGELYAKEYKFKSTHERQVVLFEGRGADAMFIEAVSGMFPYDARLSYFRQFYLDAFEPKIQAPSAGNWVSALESSAKNPLSFTNYRINGHRGGSWNPRVFVVDPTSPLDILHLWNLRQFNGNVLPFNVHWLKGCRDFLREFIERNHRPLPGNPHGVMIRTTIEFGRSIAPELAEYMSKEILNDLPPMSFSLKMWYDRIWQMSLENGMVRREHAVIEAKSQSMDLDFQSTTDPVVKFPALSPEFAGRFGRHRARWVNVISLTDFGGTSGVALTLPSTPLKLMSPRLRRGQSLVVSREGIVILQQYKDSTQYLWLLKGPTAITEWLRTRGIEASHSDSGRITDQVLTAVESFRGAHVLSDAETIKLLDKMSKSVRIHIKGNRSEEYPDRTVPVSAWLELVKRRKADPFESALDVQSFVKAGALRLGLAIECPNCKYENWYGVGHLNEQLNCERCLQEYDFPQATMNFGNTPWRYRVTGPFSVPNYAGGAYSTVLALRCLAVGLGGERNPITYSPNLNMNIDGKKIEVDFTCWYARERIIGLGEEPSFVVGETKSFADEAVQDADVYRLRLIGTKLPGTVLVIAVLKDQLSRAEKKRIGRLALWGREPMADGQWRAPVVILTGTELFASFSVEQEWNDCGGLRQELTKHAYIQMDNLVTLADLTQRAYLDLPAYGTWFEKRMEKRR